MKQLAAPKYSLYAEVASRIWQFSVSGFCFVLRTTGSPTWSTCILLTVTVVDITREYYVAMCDKMQICNTYCIENIFRLQLHDWHILYEVIQKCSWACNKPRSPHENVFSCFRIFFCMTASVMKWASISMRKQQVGGSHGPEAHTSFLVLDSCAENWVPPCREGKCSFSLKNRKWFSCSRI
jgi:hypothetical protein